jgi:glycosyltransferase involved in cell wall biosynthesis
MTISSAQIGIARICAITAHTLDTKSPTARTRRTAGRHLTRPREEPWPSVPDRLVADLVADSSSLDKAQMTPTVSVIIPTLNEAESLPWVLENLPPWVDEVLLVDGLSTDATEVLARRIRPDAVVVHQHRRGKGAALRAGFAAATGDIIVMIDADGSTDPREMHQFIAALKDGSDFVKGSRHMEGGGSADFTFLRSAGNKFFVLMANILYGSRFTDLCYGYCAFWRKNLDVLALTADGFEIETQLVLGAVKAGLEIRETPSFELRRRFGVSNLNAARDGLRVLRTMLGRGDLRRDTASIHFTLRKIYLPIWNTDRVPSAGERRWIDRRRFSRAASGYTWAKPHIDERRRTVGSVVAYRADYEQSPRQPAG